MEPVIELDGVRVFRGDCREVLRGLPDNSVDSIVTDPPYELGFMGKKWDSSGIAYDPEVWGECLRVLKPGGHLLAFGGTRTWHRLAVAIEDAGFEIRDNIAWMYGSGFPKSLDVSKAIDKNNGETGRKLKFTRWMRTTGVKVSDATRLLREAGLISENGTMAGHFFAESNAGQPAIPTAELWQVLRPHCGDVPDWVDDLVARVEAEREVIGKGSSTLIAKSGSYAITNGEKSEKWDAKEYDLTAPATPEAQKWQGWGTALKPAFEPIVVARKPLSGTVAETVLEWGTGGLNIDGSRIATDDKLQRPFGTPSSHVGQLKSIPNGEMNPGSPLGRWPANVMLDEYTAQLLDEQSGVSKSPPVGSMTNTKPRHSGSMSGAFRHENPMSNGHGDSGGASRFFYVAKASKRDRNEGLEKSNGHPTVKPTALMRYLVKLVTPPGGTVLDPFTGSGSTGKAALLEGFEFVGVELTDDYLPIIEGRLKWALENREEGTLF